MAGEAWKVKYLDPQGVKITLGLPHRRRGDRSMAKKKPDALIQLTRLEDSTLEIPITGVTPLIPHKWSEKAKRMMPGHPDKDAAKTVKGPKNPEEEADACLYYMPQEQGKAARIGMPATAFKAAIIGACRFFEKPTMVEAKQMIFVEGEGPEQLVEITYGSMVLREDTPRNTNGSSDLRYRYALHDWTAVVQVHFPANIITGDSVVTLVDAGGRGGIGDWRPSAPKSYTGTYGTWRVDQEALAASAGKKVKRG